MKELLKPLGPLKWYYLFVTCVLGWLAYSNNTGANMFSTQSAQQWNASGPSGHK